MKIPLFILAICLVEVAHCGLKKNLLNDITCKLDELEKKCDDIMKKLDAICDKLDNVNISIGTMNIKILDVSDGVGDIHDDLENINKTLEVIQECACEDGTCKPDEEVIVACGSQFEKNEVGIGTGVYSLIASLPNTAREWCMAVFPPEADEPCKYAVDVDLWNEYFKTNAPKGHIGVAYNIQDERNFDMFYFRVGQPSRCGVNGAQIGETQHLYSKNMGSLCPGHKTWFHLRVEVEPGTARALLDGILVKEWSTEQDFKAQAAVLTANSFQNEIRYSGFQVTTM